MLLLVNREMRATKKKWRQQNSHCKRDSVENTSTLKGIVEMYLKKKRKSPT